MKQPRISSNPSLINLGGLVSGGLLELGELLDLQTVDHDGFTTQLTDYIMQHGLHQQGKQELANRSGAFFTAKTNTRNFMRVTRDVMKPTLGYEYSQAWNGLGFLNTLKVPTSVSALVPMAQAVRNYLTAHPTAEVAAMNVTAAQATIIYNALNTAQQALATYKLSFKTMGNNRDAKAKALRGKIRLLTAELANVLPSVDPRWERFGLNQPGVQQRPDQPEKVSALLMGLNALSVKWKRSARAEYYRLWVKIVGVDDEAIPVASPADLDYLIENLPPQSVIELSLSAINNGGESMRSEVTLVTTL